MASCSEETVIEETSANPTEGQEGVVRFALGGAAGSATKTRAEETTIEAESDEKAVIPTSNMARKAVPRV